MKTFAQSDTKDSCYENNSIEQIREEYITLLHDYYEAMSNTVAGMSEPGTSEKSKHRVWKETGGFGWKR